MEMKNLPAVQQPKLVISPHPLSASFGRKLIYEEFLCDESLGEYLSRLNLIPARVENFLFTINSELISFDESYDKYPIQGDVIVIRAKVSDGGGDGGSDPLRIALTIAVLAASQGTAAATLGGYIGSTAVASAVILVGGMLLINALVPYKLPDLNDSQPSPTYSLSGSQNRARLFEPMPVVFGVVRMYPDHGAKPFTEFLGEDQLLIQIFNFGLSDIIYSDFKIGDTLITDFSDYEIEESVGFTGEITKFPGNIDTVIGGDLVSNAGNYITVTSSIDATRLVVGITALNYFVGREEGLTYARVKLTVEYRAFGTFGAWLPFEATNQFDIINNTKATLRISYSKFVSQGQYDVRVKLDDSADVVYYNVECDEDGLNCTKVTTYSARGLNIGGMVQFISFDQLKSYQPDSSDYTNQKRVALSIVASAQINGRIDAFNAVVSSKVLVWDGFTWTNQVSSNPAWQFLSVVRGKIVDYKRIYGAGLPDSRIDIEEIKLWGAWCDSKNLECNIVFDSKKTVIDMMNTIARCGRATTTWSNGLVGILYDEAGKPVVAAFGMSNIILNSFQVDYVTINQVDEVIVAFSNPSLGYKQDTVRAKVPGIINPVNSVTISIPGITSEVQAGKEANLIAAEQVYRRRVISWESDVEGLTVQRGDVAIMSHNLTQWDYSGRLIAGNTTTLTLDRSVPFTVGQSHYCGVRFPDGTYLINPVDIQIGESSVIVLTTPLPSSPDLDTYNIPLDYMWFFAPKPTPGKKIKITDITPISENRVKIIATDEEDDFYLTESDTYIYLPPSSLLANIPTVTGLTLGESLVIVGTGFGSVVNATWLVSGEYGGAFIRAGDEDTPMRDIGRTLNSSFNFQWTTGKTVTVEVTAYNLNFESSLVSRDSASKLLVGKAALPADVSNFLALQNGDSMILKWSPPPDIDLSGTEIRYGVRGSSNWASATPLTEVTKGTNITTFDVIDGDWTFYAKHVDTSLNYSLNAASSDVVFFSSNDIIDSFEQSPNFNGTLTNFVKHYTGKLVPKSQNLASVDGWDTFDIFVINPFLICEYEADEFDIGFDDTVRIYGDIQSSLGPGVIGIANPKLKVDYRIGAGSYDGFENWSIGNALLRFVKFKLVLDTSVGVAYISGFNPTADLKERTEVVRFDNILAGGETLTFPNAFHRPPFASGSIISVDTGVAAFVTVTGVTETSAYVDVYNLSGTSAGGSAAITLIGV